MTEQRVLTADESALFEKGIERLLVVVPLFCMSGLGSEPIFDAWAQELFFASEHAMWRDFPALACVDAAKRYLRVAESGSGKGLRENVKRARARILNAGAHLMAVATEILSDVEDPGEVICCAMANLDVAFSAMIRLDVIDPADPIIAK